MTSSRTFFNRIITRPAISLPRSIWSEVGILLIKIVSVHAFSLSFSDSPRRKTAPRIFLRSNRLKMIGVDAISYATQMVNLKAGRNKPFMQFIRKSMSGNFFTILSENSVPFIVFGGRPQPTWAKFWPGNIRRDIFDYARIENINLFRVHGVP